MADSPEVMRILGNIEGTLEAVVNDVKEIKDEQKTMNTTLTTLRVKAAGVSAGVSLVIVVAGTYLKGFISRGGQ